MSILGHTCRAQEFNATEAAKKRYPELRRIAAMKLNTFHSHDAGRGSSYVTIGDRIKIRFADHENTSSYHGEPDHNCVDRNLTALELAEIEQRVSYPTVCKKTAFAKHVGLTVPRLKKLLTSNCYELVCENPISYPNTETQYVKVEPALRLLESLGYTERRPVAQESWTVEDYAGR